MTQPATKTKATARKADAKKPTTTKATTKPKANTSTKTAAKQVPANATPAPKVETPRAQTFASTPDAAELAVKHDEMTKTVATFESFVCDLITKGISPTHIGNVVGLGNSSVRRIAMRHGLDIK